MITEIFIAFLMFVLLVLGIVMILTNGTSYYEDNCGYTSTNEMMKLLQENVNKSREASNQFITWKHPIEVPNKTMPMRSKRFTKKIRRSKFVNRV